MNDLISRQAAIDAFIDLPNCYNGFSDTYDKACIIGALEDVPSAQPEIIRCRDCRFYRPMEDQDDLCEYRLMQVFDDDFCSRAERREE